MELYVNFLRIVVFSFLFLFLGINILKNDLSFKSYRYSGKKSVFISVFSFLIILITTVYSAKFSLINLCGAIIITFVIVFLLIYLISKINSKNKFIVNGFYLTTNILGFIGIVNVFGFLNGFLFSGFYGFFIRNSAFGAPFRNFFNISKTLVFQSESVPHPNTFKKSELFELYKKDKRKSILADFSYAGFGYGKVDLEVVDKELIRYNIVDFGVKIDSTEDCTEKIQNAINILGSKGGGILFFPNGIYNVGKGGGFIRIDFSNIIIEGESNKTIFLSSHHTLSGIKNPWLSPFLFTTGEGLQSSNIFWGVQFDKKKNIITRSDSLTDPGSDGTILEPSYLCDIIENCDKENDIISVKNTNDIIKFKYILISLFNTKNDNSLLKELLQVEDFRNEWGTANRAKDEEAPSFQWLVEIDTIIDEHRIRLKQPTRIPIQLKYKPRIYGVEMLENVGFKNFTIKSKWNGLFRHHGFPIYFSRKEAQIMDYGWNAINLKRVAHGYIKNIEISNFSNPLYIQDSRNITAKDILITGASGHQGIKLYGHSCDNLIQKVEFKTDYADMMGGEGNCYGNVFKEIYYNNPENIYVDFDFHGFSEGPFSPPAFNLFENIYGFRGIKGGGALYNQPASAARNVFWNIYSQGYDNTDHVFINMAYVRKGFAGVVLSSLRHGLVSMLQKKKFNLKIFTESYLSNVAHLKNISDIRENHYKFFSKTIISGYSGLGDLEINDLTNEFIEMENFNNNVFSSPQSIYEAQRELNQLEVKNNG